MLTKRFRQVFIDKYCQRSAEDECDKKFASAVDGWMVRRYYLADFDEVRLQCNTAPDVCDDLRGYELELLDSHNQEAEQQGMGRKEQIETERETARAEQGQLVLSLVGAGLSIAAGRPNCERHRGNDGTSVYVCKE